MEYLKKMGIETSILHHLVHHQLVYRKLFSYKLGNLLITEEASSRILSLSLNLGFSSEVIVFISSHLCDALSHSL